MKKINIIFIVILSAFIIFNSCSVKRENTAIKLTEEKIKESMYHPESYDLASFKLDSAFAPYDDPQFYDLAVQLFDDSTSLAAAENDLETATVECAMYTAPAGSDGVFLKAERDKAKKSREKAQTAVDNIKKHKESTTKRIKDIVGEGRKFIGYKAFVTFRGKDNSDNVFMRDVLLFFDKDITKATDIYDRESQDYQKYLDMTEEIKENFKQKQ